TCDELLLLLADLIATVGAHPEKPALVVRTDDFIRLVPSDSRDRGADRGTERTWPSCGDVADVPERSLAYLERDGLSARAPERAEPLDEVLIGVAGVEGHPLDPTFENQLVVQVEQFPIIQFTSSPSGVVLRNHGPDGLS